MATLIYVNDVVVDESSGFAEFRVWLDQVSAVPVTVAYATGNWTANSYDYKSQNGTLSFAPGETVKTVSVQITNDSTAESTQRFKLNLSNPTNAVIEKPTGWATIYDNDAAKGTPVVTVDSLVVDEANGEALFVVRLDKPSTGTVSVGYGTRDGSAVAGQDYEATAGTLTFAPGQVVKTVVVPITNDATSEGNESFSLVLSNLIGATALGEPAGEAIIWANDGQKQTQPRLYVSDVVVDESQDFADFTVYLAQPGTSAVTVSYTTANWTANGYDYEGQSGTLSFQPGETVKTVRIDITNDSTAESTSRFKLNLSNPVNAVIEKATGWATIYDNDAAQGTPQVRIEPAQGAVNESDREAVFTVVLDRPAAGLVELDYATLNGTAVAGQDFVAAAGHLVFAPGEVSKTVRVALIDDDAAEAAENFSLALFNLAGATTARPTQAVTIAANDGARLVQPAISVADAAVTEGQRFLDFQVTLSAPGASAVTVSYTTANGTANGYDYEGQSGTLSFQPGETVKTVRIDIIDDTTAENTEQFTLKLTNPLNAVLDRATATATIYDNDGNKSLPSTAANDTYDISDPSVRPTEAANAGNDTVRSWVSYQLSDEVENLVLLGTSDIDATGNTSHNTLTGNAGHNTLRGLWGNDTIDGGAGVDTVLYTGKLADYTITWNAAQQRFTIADKVLDRDGTDAVTNVENFVFADQAFTRAQGIALYGTNTAPTGSVTIAGTPAQGQTLSASHTLADVDGLGAINWQWLRNGQAIASAAAASYTLTPADVGQAISVRASYTDDGGTAESVVSAVTALVAPGLVPVVGTPGNDHFTVQFGQGASINGGAGTDTVALPGFASLYTLAQTAPGNYAGTFGGHQLVLESVEQASFGTRFITTVAVADLASGLVQQQVAQLTDLYLAFFGRAPDVAGLEYWQQVLLQQGRDFAGIAKDFAYSTEAQALYPASSSNREFVKAIYVNALGRQPDAAGWDWWTGQLDRLGATDLSERGAFVAEVLLGAYAPTSGAQDRTLLTHRHDVALYYANRLAEQPQEGFDAGINDLLVRVTGDAATGHKAEAVIDHAFAHPVTLTGILQDPALLGSLWGQ